MIHASSGITKTRVEVDLRGSRGGRTHPSCEGSLTRGCPVEVVEDGAGDVRDDEREGRGHEGDEAGD
jgi:hypothetical protein